MGGDARPRADSCCAFAILSKEAYGNRDIRTTNRKTFLL